MRVSTTAIPCCFRWTAVASLSEQIVMADQATESFIGCRNALDDLDLRGLHRKRAQPGVPGGDNLDPGIGREITSQGHQHGTSLDGQ